MFDRLDANGDRRISLEEFCYAVPMIQKWGVNISDPETAFREIDTDGGGHVLFDEFCQWAALNNIDIEDDDDLKLSAEDLHRLQNSLYKTPRNFLINKGKYNDSKIIKKNLSLNRLP